jgi:hypothetical protein
VQPQQTKQPSGSDFTKPDDIQAMNRRFAAQRAYQQFPPVNGASYKHMSSNPAQATAMAGKN